MLTADKTITAHAVTDRLNIDRVEAGVLPGQKANIVKQLQQAGKVVGLGLRRY